MKKQLVIAQAARALPLSHSSNKGSKTPFFCSRQALCLQKNVVRPTPSTRQRLSCAFTRRNSFNKTDSADADVCNRLCFSTALLPPCVHGSGSGQGCFRQQYSDIRRPLQGYFSQIIPLYLLQFFFTSISAGNRSFLLPTTARDYWLLATGY